MLKSLDDLGRQTWALHVEALLFWVSQAVGDINLFILQFQQRMGDIMT